MSIKYDFVLSATGKQAEVQTPLIDELVEIVSGKKASSRRDLAVEILKYVAQKQAESEGRPMYDRPALQMMLNLDVSGLWNRSDKYQLQMLKDRDGVERLGVVRVDIQHAPAPMPAPVPTFEPAVPLPVLPVSDVEKQAVNDLSFDERYSPGAVAARVAAIEREAAQMRASREQR